MNPRTAGEPQKDPKPLVTGKANHNFTRETQPCSRRNTTLANNWQPDKPTTTWRQRRLRWKDCVVGGKIKPVKNMAKNSLAAVVIHILMKGCGAVGAQGRGSRCRWREGSAPLDSPATINVGGNFSVATPAG